MALAEWQTESAPKAGEKHGSSQKYFVDLSSHSVGLEHLAHFCYSRMESETDKRSAEARRLSMGCARLLLEHSKPCRSHHAELRIIACLELGSLLHITKMDDLSSD